MLRYRRRSHNRMAQSMWVVDNQCLARVLAEWEIEDANFSTALFDLMKESWKDIVVNLVDELLPERRRYAMEWKGDHFFSPNLSIQIRPPFIPPSLTPGQIWHDDGCAGYSHSILWTNREPVMIRKKGTD